MRIKTYKLSKIIFVLLLGVMMIASTSFARDKNISTNQSNSLAKPTAFGETVVNIGSLHNYFSNSTITKATGNEEHAMLIGADDLSQPSMMWLEGGYALNHYLYFGLNRSSANGSEIHYSTLTSEDWTVLVNDPTAKSAYQVSFSMTDELAGALSQGIWCGVTYHAWSESYRDDFFIMEYDVVNNGDEEITDFYTWWHMDCDISAPGGGSGALAFYRDDMPGYYLGTDANGNPEHLSFMYDADNPNIDGDDTGGRNAIKESSGYLGSRVLSCPAPTDGDFAGVANTQSGHQWWDWNSDPDINIPGDFTNLATRHEYKADPGSPHDYRYMQILGPFTIAQGETLHYAIGMGLGEGLDGLRANLQWAYDIYNNNFVGPAAPVAPNVMLTRGDGFVHIEWDDQSEASVDPLTGEQDFEGYRIYRSTDQTNWSLLADFDVVNGVGFNQGLPAKNTNGMYEYMDESVTNGFVYYYTVAAYDQGTEDLEPLETGKVVDLFTEPGPVAVTASLDEDAIYVVPNPFVGKAPWDFTPTLDNPAEERIQFQGIPLGAKITVFNLAGDMIIELEQEGTDGFVNWDLITRNTQKAVSGLYLYVVEAENEDSFVGKFVIVR